MDLLVLRKFNNLLVKTNKMDTPFLKFIALVILATAIVSVLFIATAVKGADDVIRKIIITENAYTSSYEWPDAVVEVKTTATVTQSECNACREYMDVTQCQKDFNTCLNVN